MSRAARRCAAVGLLSAIAALAAGCGDRSPPVQTPLVEEIPSPASPSSALPRLAGGHGNPVVMSWVEDEGDRHALRYAVLESGVWSEPLTVARGADWFVNWADFPSVVPLGESLWAAHWLVKRPGGKYAYDVAVSVSRDAGASWLPAVTPHTDGTASEHGFVSLFPWRDAVGAVWLDGRLTAPAQHDSAVAESAPPGAMTLRSAVIAADGSLGEGALLDPKVCDCCQTDVAVGPHGPLAVYRDRSGEEIRDISIARALRPAEWTPPRPVADDGWRIAGCPVNGPAIASEEERIAVAWFTAADDAPRVRIAFSTDGGGEFGPPLEVTAERALGRVDVVMLRDGAAVSWLRNGNRGNADLCLRAVSASGELRPVRVIAQTSAAPASGFPRMLREGDDLLLAWTERNDAGSRVRSARVRLPL